MAKPNINKLGQVGEIFVQKYERYLPTAFDESLTILEKMNKIIEYMNSIGVLVNGAFSDWNKIMEWVLGDGLDDGISKRLDEMMTNGEFDTIINQTLLGSRARIFVSKNPPNNIDQQTYWYEDLGENPIFGGSGTGGLLVSNATVGDDMGESGLLFKKI